MSNDYWSRISTYQLGRRKAATTGLRFAAAAVLIAACGGGSSKPKQENVSSLVTVPQDTTKSATRGGTLTLRRSADVTHFDPFIPLGSAGLATGNVFSRLIQIGRAHV